MPYTNIMKSYDAGVAPTLQDYFQRRALKNVQPNLGYAQDAQMLSIPAAKGDVFLRQIALWGKKLRHVSPTSFAS